MSVIRTDRCRECGHVFSAMSMPELDGLKAEHDTVCARLRSNAMTVAASSEKAQRQPGSLNAELHRLRSSLGTIVGGGEIAQHLMWLTDLVINIELRRHDVEVLQTVVDAIEAETSTTDREFDAGYSVAKRMLDAAQTQATTEPSTGAERK